MKQAIKVLLLAVLLSVTNGCGVAKNKYLEKNKSSATIKNDISVSSVKIDSAKGSGKVSKSGDEQFYSEEISIKKNDAINNIELTANFKVDTGATLSGDTALKLVDVNNGGVSLSIFQNKKTKELMAKVTTSAGSKVTPFSEINIKRQYGQKSGRVDSAYQFENHSEIQTDSLEKTATETTQKQIIDKKHKETKPDWKVWSIAVLVVATALTWGFKKK